MLKLTRLIMIARRTRVLPLALVIWRPFWGSCCKRAIGISSSRSRRGSIRIVIVLLTRVVAIHSPFIYQSMGLREGRVVRVVI